MIAPGSPEALLLGKALTHHTPCPFCGAVEVRLNRPRGPHSFKLICTQCNKDRGWVPKRAVPLLLRQLEAQP